MRQGTESEGEAAQRGTLRRELRRSSAESEDAQRGTLRRELSCAESYASSRSFVTRVR